MEVPSTWDFFFSFPTRAEFWCDESTRSKCGRLSTWRVFIGLSSSHVCYLGKCRFEMGRVQSVCVCFRVLKGVLRLSKLDQLDFATSDKCDFLRRGCVSICPLLRRLWFSCSCVQNFSVFDLFLWFWFFYFLFFLVKWFLTSRNGYDYGGRGADYLINISY